MLSVCAIWLCYLAPRVPAAQVRRRFDGGAGNGPSRLGMDVRQRPAPQAGAAAAAAAEPVAALGLAGASLDPFNNRIPMTFDSHFSILLVKKTFSVFF